MIKVYALVLEGKKGTSRFIFTNFDKMVYEYGSALIRYTVLFRGTKVRVESKNVDNLPSHIQGFGSEDWEDITQSVARELHYRLDRESVKYGD